ncbi:hypothetical protein RM844_03990 [Streptomyces sp. DSM 44915]|uniref:ATP-binding protein n=1 Tax=Streptomyces chisholmiae TaxID=3075540 RepID=A0ABU2JKD9_9ACTN|nr:hypothetical protein [Streptomyces sp. DSM 44915]MDT0265451.1 hypothetical protein [Streptomyces sp. DSM 44915]
MSNPARHPLVRAALIGAAGVAGLLGTATAAQAAAPAAPAPDTSESNMVGDTVNGLGRGAVDVVNQAGAEVAPHLREGARTGGSLLTGVAGR